MAELCSVGLDVGTTTTQMILSRLQIENKAGAFSVPQMQITGREILYEGAVLFTPLLGKDRVDGAALQALIAAEYQRAGITPAQVDTGAVIITGETSRKENAKAVMDVLAEFAGEFVVTTAGPHLESVLAAKGSGATDYSRETGKTVLHMDIGGGTANLAWIEDGQIQKTGCLNVGGRLIKTDGNAITYVSPVVNDLMEVTDLSQLEQLVDMLVQALEMAAGLRPRTALFEMLWTQECGAPWQELERAQVLSFSGGVADCIEKVLPPFHFGDIGPILGKKIRESRLCQGDYRLGAQTIRATVIGAGCHSTQLSGSTVFYQNVQFPMKNLPVVQQLPRQQEAPVVLALPGLAAPSYAQVQTLARELAENAQGGIYIALETDMAKALGQALSLLLPKETAILCIDRVCLGPESYLDVGAPVGPCLPVVVKTLVLQNQKQRM